MASELRRMDTDKSWENRKHKKIKKVVHAKEREANNREKKQFSERGYFGRSFLKH